MMDNHGNDEIKGHQAQSQIDEIMILLVDDDIYMLDSLKTLMVHYGYRVDVAVGGRAAIERLADNSYDLLLLDLKMPEVDGHDVLAHMSIHDIETLTILVSGETSFSEMTRALRNGAYDYLKKPYSPEELVATLNNAIRKLRLEASNKKMQLRLEQSEQLHRFVVDNSADIIFMLDEKGAFRFLNSKTESLLGFKKEALLGKHISTLIDAEDLERANYFFEHIDLDSDVARSIELTLKSQGISHSKRYFELSVWPLTEHNQGALTYNSSRFRLYGTARDISDRKEAQDFINFQAYHDLLTRLPNRTLFRDRLNMAMEQSKRNDSELAVMFLDLDRFKVINDSLGHSVGDRLLQAVSLRLTRCLRRGDTLSRFGGDEFTLLLPEVNGVEGAEKIAKKIIKYLKQPFRLGEHEIVVGASIGIVLYPSGGRDIETLIQNADIAMYEVKGNGRAGYAFYSKEMNLAAENQLHFERDLRRALENDELVIHYQPQIDAISGNIEGVEALVRWQHPTKGFIYPNDFIPLAEETKLILEIDQWILNKACKEVKHWYDMGLLDVKLAVNFSPLWVEQPDFVESFMTILENADFPGDKFEMEITENAIMSDLDQIVEKLIRINDKGISVAIDDFGTGYSSLNYLQKFPIHTLKIDQSFVQNIKADGGDTCIVDAIVAMAKGLKLNIVAEGVETEVQRRYLYDLGCHQMQGFLFGRATSGEEIMHSFDDGNINGMLKTANAVA